MDTRLARELDYKLIDAYLKLDPSQLDKPNIQQLFQKVQISFRVLELTVGTRIRELPSLEDDYEMA